MSSYEWLGGAWNVQETSTPDNIWADILAMPTKAVYTKKFVIKGNRNKTKIPEMPKNKTRKRRRTARSTIKPNRRTQRTTGPTKMSIELSSSIEDARQTVVNALSCILPLDVKMNIFGFWHSVILVGVFYRHDNLCWLMLSRVNLKLYLSSHFVADSLHLFRGLRKYLKLPQTHRDKKWTRQGVNDIMCFSKTIEAIAKNKSRKLNTLPATVLKFIETHYAQQQVNEFIRGTGTGGYLLHNFTRKQPLPPGFNPVTGNLADVTHGWKVFKKNTGNGCISSITTSCCCYSICTNLLNSGIDKMAAGEAIVEMMKSLPSSLDRPECSELQRHYRPFIQYVKNNPQLIFLPDKDIYLSEI